MGDTKALHEDQEAVHIGEPTSYDAVESLDTEHDGLTQEFHKKAIETSEAINRNVIVRVYTPGSSAPAFVKLQASDTVGSIVVAEHKLNTTEMPVTSLRMNSNIGLPIPSSHAPLPMQQLFLVDIGAKPTQQCPHGKSHIAKPDIQYPTTRLSVLYQQGSWVAEDEIQYYFSHIESEGLGRALPPIIIRSTLPTDLEIQAISGIFQKLPRDSPRASFTALLVENHWVPVVIFSSQDSLEIHTAHEGIEVLSRSIQQTDFEATLLFNKVDVPSFFPADCGFQTLGCILGLLGSPKCTGLVVETLPGQTTTWFSQQTAESWRVLFEHHLLCTDFGSALIHQSLFMGGVGKDDLQSQLTLILGEHGVPREEVESRATLVFDRIGRAPIAKAFRASRPWAEIKSLANSATPKVQLVLPSELQEVVNARLQDPTPFGDKRQKQNKLGKGPKPPLRLLAKDLEITMGLFKQGEDTPISQIKPEDIGPDAQGVVILNACDAYSYLKLTSPISRAGLAILVLEHHDPALHGIGELLRFPARCVPTGEPIILTVKLVQAGSIRVSRHCPAQQLSVEEVPTSVIRAVVFRDECDIPWQQFLDHPVRHIVSQNPALQDSDGSNKDGNHTILDVWDRQTLSKKFAKVKGSEADMFIVSLRLAIEDPRPILQMSGKQGTYYEPRTSDGRNPNEHYHVVWLNKVEKSDAVTAQQVASIWTSVVRHGG